MTTPSISLAIVGAATALGESLVEALSEFDLPLKAVHFVDDEAATTGRILYDGHYQAVKVLQGFDFAGVDLVLFATPAKLTIKHAGRARTAGCRVIDLSGAHSLGAGTALVLAEIHAQVLGESGPGDLFACPDPVSAQLARVIQPLLTAGHEVARVDCVACRAAIMKGKAGSEALAYETVQLLNMRQPERFLYGRQLAFNLLPVELSVTERVVAETLKILDNQSVEINLRLVDSPVFQANSLQCFIDFNQEVSLQACQDAWVASPALCWHEGEAPSAVDEAAGERRVVIGGLLRRAGGHPGVSAWSVADSLGGQAWNALSVAQILVKSVL